MVGRGRNGHFRARIEIEKTLTYTRIATISTHPQRPALKLTPSTTVPATWWFCAVMMAIASPGCDAVRTYFGTTVSGKPAAAPPPITQVNAQGVLVPAGGVLPIHASPGDRVASVTVGPGDSVEPGQLLVELESLRLREIELRVARTQLREGQARLAAERSAAQAKLQVAKIGLKQAESMLQQARERLRLAESAGGRLDLLRRAAELGQRKLDQLRDASQDPSTRRLVSSNNLDEESLRVSEARATYENAKTESNEAITRGQLDVEAASQEIAASQLAIEAVAAGNPIESIQQQIELLELKLAAAQIRSPIAGRVLDVDAMVGAATSAVPLMSLADLSQMVCEAEINVGDLPRVAVGQTATITSPGLPRPITGVVARVQPIVQSPQLASPFPMAVQDRHAVQVVIDVDPADVDQAARLIQLQVEVVIDIDGRDS